MYVLNFSFPQGGRHFSSKNKTTIICPQCRKQTGLITINQVAQEVVSLTRARPTLRVFEQLRRKYCLCNYIRKWLDFQVFLDKDCKPLASSHKLCGTLKIPHNIQCEHGTVSSVVFCPECVPNTCIHVPSSARMPRQVNKECDR